MDLKAAWAMDDETGRFAAPQTMEFDPDVQSGYGLDRLELRECELRYPKDVDEALSGVDAVVWCASSFNAFRQRLPDRVDEAARSIDQRGMALFELRLGKALFGEEDKEDGSDPARREAARGKTADVEGLETLINVMDSTRRRRTTLAELTGIAAAGVGSVTPLVVCSCASALGYDEDRWGGTPQENEFGFRKRSGEALIAASDVPHVIVRSAAIDDVRGEEGLDVQTIEEPDAASRQRLASAAAGEAGADAATEAADAVGVVDKEAKKRRIAPRDLARFLVSCLEPRSSSTVVEAWTYTE